VLRRIPGLRRVFGNENRTEANSETIVLITPHLVGDFDETWNAGPTDKVDNAQRAVDAEVRRLESDASRFSPDAPSPSP
jgi:type II secretory pathway component GspD/PulD (secretin)